MTNEIKTPAVYLAIKAITKEFVGKALPKDKTAKDPYAHVKIDALMNRLAPLLVEHDLIIIPRCSSREVTEHAAKNGTATFSVVLGIEYQFISLKDQSTHTVHMIAEAMNGSGKATASAMSMGYKYMALQTFCIPTGDGDPDEEHTEVISRRPSARPVAPRTDAPVPIQANPALLSPEQIATIESLAAQVGKDPRAIATAFKKASLNFIEQEAYEQIVKGLKYYLKEQSDE